MQGKLDESVEQFKKAYELQPKYDEAAKLYALVLIRSGKDKEAVDLLTKQFGTPAVDDKRLFNEWVMAKRYDIVASILEKRVEENPGDIQQKVSLAATYKKMGEKQKALDLLQKIKDSNPEYADQMDGFIKEIRGW
jgi:thioredoxin-like negative regulator of GroEL